MATPIQRRLIDASAAIMGDAADDLAFLHVIFSQIGLPYREPDSDFYRRRTGRASLALTAGGLLNPHTGEFEKQGLPYGAKPRLFMCHLCTEAVRLQSPVVPIADSMSALMRLLGLKVTGGAKGSIGQFKEQTNRLIAARLQFGMVYEPKTRAVVFNPAPMVEAAELWFPDNPAQRTLWASEVRLSDTFFSALKDYALPLDPRAIRGLQHSARALDVYTWLAHRLWRVTKHAGEFVSWEALQEQFGSDVADIRKFRALMRIALKQVRKVYPAAKVDEVPGEPGRPGGLKLFPSPPPIPRTTVRGARVGAGDHRWRGGVMPVGLA